MVVSIGCSSCRSIRATHFVLFTENEDIDARCSDCTTKVQDSSRDVEVVRIGEVDLRDAIIDGMY